MLIPFSVGGLLGIGCGGCGRLHARGGGAFAKIYFWRWLHTLFREVKSISNKILRQWQLEQLSTVDNIAEMLHADSEVRHHRSPLTIVCMQNNAAACMPIDDGERSTLHP
jgi:hypothetical protein